MTTQQDGRDSLGSESSSKVSDDVDSSMDAELVTATTECSKNVTVEGKTISASARTDISNKEAVNGICDSVRYQ